MRYLIFAIILTGCITPKPTARIEFIAPDVYPEGVAYDKAANVYYVSSMRSGAIGKVTPQGSYSVFYADTNFKSSYGLKVHPDGKRLFACISDANYSKYSTPETKKKMVRLVSFDLATGKKLTDTDLSALIPGKHFGNDITFDEQANVYMTDSYANVIYKITPSGAASVFAKDKQFETQGFGLNGIVYHPGGFLLVASSNKGRIYKVDIKNPQSVQQVNIEQYFMGADGLVLNDNNTLTMAVNGGNNKIFQLTTDNNWQTATLAKTTLAADRFTYPATATMNGKEVWVMNAKTSELPDSNAVPSKNFAIQQAVLKPVPRQK